MGFQLTLHHDALVTVSTDARVLPEREVAPLQDALALLGTLRGLLDGCETKVADEARAARELGYREGYAAGLAQALQESAEQLASALHDVTTQLRGQRDELREALVTLATGLVRCMATEMAPDELVTAMALRAFEQVVPPQPVRLRLPPALVDGVRAQLAQRELPLPVQCLADPSLAGLACVVESQAGALLAGLDDLLAHAARQLQGQRQSRTLAA